MDFTKNCYIVTTLKINTLTVTKLLQLLQP
jgi:hypothetical protein